MRRRNQLTIWRDDHIGDSIGRIFLDPAGEGEDGIIERLRQYLGDRIRIVKAELMRDRVALEVESSGLVTESQQLSAAASDLLRKGARRNARSLFQEALDLDPLNTEAAYNLGSLMADLEDYPAALRMLKRARETGGDDAELLQALGHVCARLERIPSAISYLQQALDLRPNDPTIRRALIAMGHTPSRATAPPRRMSVVRKRRQP